MDEVFGRGTGCMAREKANTETAGGETDDDCGTRHAVGNVRREPSYGAARSLNAMRHRTVPILHPADQSGIALAQHGPKSMASRHALPSRIITNMNILVAVIPFITPGRPVSAKSARLRMLLAAESAG